MSRRDYAFIKADCGAVLRAKLGKDLDKMKLLGFAVAVLAHLPFFVYLSEMYWVEKQAVLRSLCALLAASLFLVDALREQQTTQKVCIDFSVWLGLSVFSALLSLLIHPSFWALAFAFFLRGLLWRLDISFWLVPVVLGLFVCPWDYILGPLIDGYLCESTAYVADFVVNRAGLNTQISFLSAHTIEGDGFSLSVVPACAGVQTFVALQTLSLVLSVVLYSRKLERIVFFLLFVFFGGFIGNTLRIIASCYCAYWFSDNVDYWNIAHDSLGILTYVFVILAAVLCEKFYFRIWSRTRQDDL